MHEETRQQRQAQRRAYELLGQLIERGERENLPVITWVLASANTQAILTGDCEAADPIQRQADFEAWKKSLGAEAWPNGIRSEAGIRLSASTVDPSEEVTITLSAFIANDEM
ncbi:hypothetical protein [Nonomuraea sp. NPDC050310]|uniref:hypothetical protein n=1 Tax=Nonomuraea sp. NPDC050310 TaxID=3154935 RepID=UPI0033D9751E